MSASEREPPELPGDEFRVVTEDGMPALELPTGQTIRLNITVTEWTHDRPMRGEHVDMQVETEWDDFAWWTVYPERSDVMAADTERNFPEIVISPEVLPQDGDDDE